MSNSKSATIFSTFIGIILGILLIVAAFCSATGWVLFLIFMILRLCNVIAWSWWLVCIPLIIWVVSCIYYAAIKFWVGD